MSEGNGERMAEKPAVHSANKWEAANFGDDEQKQKFLRLMGGMKKQHSGRFVIGETNKNAHARTATENEQLEETLQTQYRVGLEAKLSGQNKRHVGLGFSDQEEKTQEEKPKGAHTRFSDSEDGGDADKKDGKTERHEEGKERRDVGRRRSQDEESGSREKGRSDKGKHKDGDEKSTKSKTEERKHRREEELDEKSEHEMKKHKHKKRHDTSSDSD